MAVPEQVPHINYVGNGETTNYPITFKCPEITALKVTINEVEALVGSFHVENNEVVFFEPPANGAEIKIWRDTVLNRDTEYQSFDNSFRPETLNYDFDRVWLKLQELGLADWLQSLKLDKEIQERILADINYDQLAQNRENELRQYLESLINKIAGVDYAPIVDNFVKTWSGQTQREKNQEAVSVEDYWLATDPDHTLSFQRACALGKQVVATRDSYTLTGEIPLSSGCHLHFKSNPDITFNLDGENGRGFFFPIGTQNAKVTGSANITTVCNVNGSDGTRNGLFIWGGEYYLTADPEIISDCVVDGEFHVKATGTANIKVAFMYGYVENSRCSGVIADQGGKINYAFGCHWVGNGASGVLPTKTWHPHNIEFSNNRAVNTDGSLLRAITLSAVGKATIKDNVVIDSEYVALNLFVGDYGYTYAANLNDEQCFDIVELNNYINISKGSAISVDAISSGLNASPIWIGCDHNATLKSHESRIFYKDQSSLAFAFTGLSKLVADFDICKTVMGTRSVGYVTSCKSVVLRGNIASNDGLLCRDVHHAEVDIHFTNTQSDYSGDSYCVGASARSFATTLQTSAVVGAKKITLAHSDYYVGSGGYIRFTKDNVNYEVAMRSTAFVGSVVEVAVDQLPVAIDAGTALTVIQTVRSIKVRGFLEGANTNAYFVGTSVAKVRSVDIDMKTSRSGTADVYAREVESLRIKLTSDNCGQSIITENKNSVYLGANVEDWIIDGCIFEKSSKARYLIQQHNSAKDGVISNCIFSGKLIGTSPACIFRKSGSATIIRDVINNTGGNLVYPAS